MIEELTKPRSFDFGFAKVNATHRVMSFGFDGIARRISCNVTYGVIVRDEFVSLPDTNRAIVLTDEDFDAVTTGGTISTDALFAKFDEVQARLDARNDEIEAERARMAAQIEQANKDAAEMKTHPTRSEPVV